MKRKFTDGPWGWRVTETHMYLVMRYKATTQIMDVSKDDGPSKADAALIEASPELFECLDNLCNGPLDVKSRKKAWEEAKALLGRLKV